MFFLIAWSDIIIFKFNIKRKDIVKMDNNRYELNKELAQMLKGGVIMDVTTPEQAKIAEASGACAVMALERIPADIRAAGGVSRMSDTKNDKVA
ncbi:Pyridoxal biosynthesis lyase pdxS [Candidatus Arthromitus sp. SFB-5]|nr:Pyridoxal biosynthesis lyase pdxS [Candidatus Arthromitus sp. SFB-5]